MSTLKLSTLSNLAGSQSTAVENAINGSAKAWVNFNGTGTVAIRRAYNVSSITDNNTGDYTVNFTNAMSDTSYSVAGFGMRNSASGSGAAGAYVCAFGSATYSDSFATTSIRIQTKTDNGTMEDFNSVSVSIFR